MLNKQIIIGLGTGRCGTHSLALLLNKQKNTNITHELNDQPFLPWDKNLNKLKQVFNILDRKLNNFNTVGDISFYHLPYVNNLIEKYSQIIKFISINRCEEEVIKSYIKWTEGRNHWVNHNGTKWRHDRWDICYPKYDVEKKIDALKLYCNEYKNTIDYYKEKYPDKFFLMDMEHLNNENNIIDILNFCGFEDKNIIVGLKNSTQQYGNT